MLSQTQAGSDIWMGEKCRVSEGSRNGSDPPDE